MYPFTQNLIATYLEEGIYPGVSYAWLNHQSIETHALGNAQILPNKRPLTKETLFDVASLTKVICTNSIILKLLEDQQIKLDQPLHAFLPDVKDQQVTIRQLLTHTSGINPFIDKRDTLDADELRAALLKLTADPKIEHPVAYTDTGTLLLGFLIEELYRQPLHDVFQTRVLTPLMMTNSTFAPQGENIAATEVHAKRGIICGAVHDPKAYVLGQHCGSAGLFTNLEDCLIFVQMILTGGLAKDGQRFLQAATIRQLFSDQTPSRSLKRSLGWDLKSDPLTKQPLLFHTGYTGTFIIIDQHSQEAFVFLSNRIHPTDQRDRYLEKRDAILASYLKEKTQLR